MSNDTAAQNRRQYNPAAQVAMNGETRINVGSLIANRARISPNLEAWVDVDTERRFTFEQWNKRINQTSHMLTGLGVKPGDRVALLAMNCVEFMESFMAIAKIGAIGVPLNWRLTPKELEFILKDSGSSMLIYSSEFGEAVSALQSLPIGALDIRDWLSIGDAEAPSKSYADLQSSAPENEPKLGGFDDDTLYIMYTSGTTGLPKGVVHTHDSVFWGLTTLAFTSDTYFGDRYYCCLPLFHVGALTPALSSAYGGVTLVVPRSFDPVKTWQTIEREKICNMMSVPAMLGAMKMTFDMVKPDYSSLRWMTCGAAPVPVDLIHHFGGLGVDILQVYGLTETCGPACLIDAKNAIAKAGSTGPAFFHTQIRVVDAHDVDCPPGVAGEVIVAGRHILKEYWNRPDATAEAIKNGWFYTGDIATMDADGFVYICDRKKDMIITGGENVYPAEVENALFSHPKVGDVAIIGQKCAKWGEVPLAIIIKSDDSLTEVEILEYCDGQLARYKQPKGVRFVTEIPRNPSGKILKRVLREQFPEDAEG